MATDSRFLSEDQFTCSICLDVFTEPVSIPCGHNFCKGCISLHWEGKELCKCPLCNEKFSKELKVCVNTAFRDVVESFKKRQSVISNNDTPIKPGQVACDCCLDNKVKASKSCLVCLTSFCETHLEPHRKVAALKRHKLTHPVHNLEDKICKEHNRIVELFCRDDLMNICVQCTEHSDHDIVPLEEACVNKMAQARRKKVKEQEVKQKHGKKGKKSKVQNRRNDKASSTVCSLKPNIHCCSCCSTVDPNQCDIYSVLPGHIGFSEGKFCYEVELLEGTTYILGIIRESLQGKPLHPNPQTGSWLISIGDKCDCMALHDQPLSFVLKIKPKIVMVCVDYEKGSVYFSDRHSGDPIYRFIGCKFNERVFLFSGPVMNWVQRLRMNVKNMTLKDICLCFLFLAFYLIIITENETSQRV
ncbi:E3 ubiquitin/ISG15 ligase TRIM25-like [Cheilinus undulatus]|uniref:E3 ubiquitin/ISG15 ligase TRIM25-like n=1 Tax=Cheilinus undulatus TaxID=241271 RepID=UPI001BD6CE70|nr:E3 ubiquitin/ISG15 ligase TRIM25-like [Cheilinus undulatus]XP_041648955.1 E3 ubiquitin/ISG15 ligase TRIM25-like [Cheilinus undulatus]XP_041648956.1 E3 ubiquitin/ISG15 ligase TRIM25-like [Cheilinus undulatus]